MDALLVISLILHLIATVVWIGGLLLMTLIIFPASQQQIDRQLEGQPEKAADAEQSLTIYTAIYAVLDQVRKRFYPLTNLSLLVLTVTGFYQMSVNPHYDGLLQFTNDWSRAILWKHVAVIGMIAVGGAMQWSIIPAIERAQLRLKTGRPAPELAYLRRRERRLSAVNCVLGVVVLVFTAFATAL